MANVRLIFFGDNDEHLECYLNLRDEITIEIGRKDDHDLEKRLISLDKPTAIRLVKTLKTIISQMEG